MCCYLEMRPNVFAAASWAPPGPSGELVTVPGPPYSSWIGEKRGREIEVKRNEERKENAKASPNFNTILHCTHSCM